ncbi:uncharacterized protein [Musca autumnalis]|uniref:uncharacterized protein n=1 Tax=Musca autumnalis TaxID=221902 RepID=UPI003CFA8E7B
MSFSKSVIYFTIVWVSLAMAAKDHLSVKQTADLGLLKFISRSNDLLKQNPVRSVSCFGCYIPLLTEITEEFEKKNDHCSATATDARNDLEENAAEDLKDLSERSTNVCQPISGCKDGDSAKSVFQCYVDESSHGSRSLQGIGNDATLKLGDLQEQLRRVESEEKSCFFKNQMEYEDHYENAYAEFLDCLNGVNTNICSPEGEGSGDDSGEGENPSGENPSGNNSESKEDIMPEEDLHMFIPQFRKFLV